MLVSADADERTLREIYLPAFEHIVTQAQPATVMCAYNKINGVYAAQNRWLLTEVLREEWGFAGAGGLRLGRRARPRWPRWPPGWTWRCRAPMARARSGSSRAVRAGELDEALVDAAVGRVLVLTGLAADPAGADLRASTSTPITPWRGSWPPAAPCC